MIKNYFIKIHFAESKMSDTEVDTGVSGNTIRKLKKPVIGVRSRGWCITLNNPTKQDILDFGTMYSGYEFIAFQVEAGNEGTPHIQGYVYYSNPRTWNAIQKRCPRAHIEAAKGSPQQNLKYCSKEEGRIEGPYQDGELPQQGRRSDLEQIATDFLASDEKNFALENPAIYIRYHKGLQALKNVTVQSRDRSAAAYIEWRYGLSGVGKTRVVMDSFDSVFIKDGTQWWDGYRQQECIVVDDFDGRWPYRDFLRFLDRYAFKGQVKGGYVEINSPNIFITCEYPPWEFWSDNELKQVLRRLSNVVHVTDKSETVIKTDEFLKKANERTTRAEKLADKFKSNGL